MHTERWKVLFIFHRDTLLKQIVRDRDRECHFQILAQDCDCDCDQKTVEKTEMHGTEIPTIIDPNATKKYPIVAGSITTVFTS